jgi:Na+-transporting methylmalonyl-CoA/oxaloacetate decarboxylase beta subunit
MSPGSRTFVHLFHLIVVGSLFLYVGIKRNQIPQWIFPVLFGLGVIIWVYHSFKTYKRVVAGETPWVNLLHVFYVGPILIYIGHQRTETPRYIYEILLILGFAAIGYHGLYVLEDLGLYNSK